MHGGLYALARAHSHPSLVRDTSATKAETGVVSIDGAPETTTPPAPEDAASHPLPGFCVFSLLFDQPLQRIARGTRNQTRVER